jgi:hypothetical protein
VLGNEEIVVSFEESAWTKEERVDRSEIIIEGSEGRAERSEVIVDPSRERVEGCSSEQ